MRINGDIDDGVKKKAFFVLQDYYRKRAEQESAMK
jgi:hypothetical protein